MDKFKYFYDNSALTFEGCEQSTENVEFLIKWIKKYKANVNDDIRVHWITGSEMNEYYHLTGTNAYQDDLHICVVEPDDIDLLKLTIPRFELGGRWFDDIVDNNAAREAE